MSKNLSRERVGIKGKNKFGSIMEIVEYKNTGDIIVKFERGNSVHTNWKAFCKGDVKNPYDKSVYGIGYLGEGIYKTKTDGKHTPQYSIWHGMIKRCYYEKDLKRNPTYKDCFVSNEWQNFQTFAQWYDENFYEVESEPMNIDKDILVKGNKIYSPENCIFVPKRINSLFVKNDSARSGLPIGVCFDKARNKYIASCKSLEGKQLSRYNTPEEAYEVYKSCKEKIIKEVAERYVNKIPVTLYNAMLNYKVEMED